MTETNIKDQFIQIRVDTDWLAKIDGWRWAKAQTEKRDVSRSEAIRALVSEGIAE